MAIVTVDEDVNAVVELPPATLQLLPVMVNVFVLDPEDLRLKVKVAVVPTREEKVGVWAEPAPFPDAICNDFAPALPW